jgi:hypothetical protein
MMLYQCIKHVMLLVVPMMYWCTMLLVLVLVTMLHRCATKRLLHFLHRALLDGLHISKQAPPIRPFVAFLQKTLRETDIGQKFFGNVARAETVKNVLQEAGLITLQSPMTC